MTREEDRTFTPRPYQTEALKILAKNSSGLLADGLGTGKTLMAVEHLDTVLGRFPTKRIPRVLVVAPVNTHRQWKKTYHAQFSSLPDSMCRIVGTPGSDPESWKMMTTKKGGVYIVGWEVMTGMLGYEILTDSEGQIILDDDTGEPVKRKIPVLVKEINKAMRDGRVPPWHKTGVWDLIILDESHRALNRKGLTYKVLRRIKGTDKLACSATPARNKPPSLWGILNWLWPEKYNDYWGWVDKFFWIHEKRVGQSTVQEEGDEKKPGLLWDDIPCAVRRLTEDVADQLPGVVVHEVEVPMTAAQQKMYDDFEAQAFAWLDEVPVGTPLPIVQRIRLRQAALGELVATEGLTDDQWERLARSLLRRDATRLLEKTKLPEERRKQFLGALVKDVETDVLSSVRGLKNITEAERQHYGLLLKDLRDGAEARETRIEAVDLDALDISYKDVPHPKIGMVKEIIEDLPDDAPVMIFTHSAKFAVLCARKLGTKARAWYGGTSQAKRQELKETFGTDYRILVAVVAAIGEGTDGLQQRAHHEIWLSQAEDAMLNIQAEGRLNRPGQDKVVQRWYVRSPGTIDEDVYLDQMEKRAALRATYKDNR